MYLKYSGYTKREVRHEVQAKRAEEEWEAAIREYEEQEIKRNNKNLGGSNNEKNKAFSMGGTLFL